MEQQLSQVIKLLENERHEKIVALLLDERKLGNEQHQQQLKQLSSNHIKQIAKVVFRSQTNPL